MVDVRREVPRQDRATSELEPGETPMMGIEEIDPRLLQIMLTLSDDEVLVPLRMNRADVHKVKAVKISDNEAITMAKFQVYLHDRGYIPDNTFASLFCYLYNVVYTAHLQLAREEAAKEG